MDSTTELIQNFLHHCKYEKKLSENTIRAYIIDLKQFESFVKLKDCASILDKVLIKEFLKHLNDMFKVRTVKRKIACVKAFYNHMEYENDNLINPFRKIRIKIKEPFRIPKVMSLSDINQVFNKVYKLKQDFKNKSSFSYKAHIRDIAILELLFATGLRVSEVCHLKKENVNLTEGYVKVLGKGNKERVIQICNKDVINAIKLYNNIFLPSNTNYFFSNRLNKRISEQSVRSMVKKYSPDLNKPITPHIYRHTFATMLLEEGVDIKYIQIMLGHSSILTTQIYTHVTNTKQKQILLEKHPRRRVELHL